MRFSTTPLATVSLGLASGCAAFFVFWLLPPMQVMVGMRSLEALVPAHYQASVFLSFVPFSLAALTEWRQHNSQGARRVGVIVSTGALSVVRLVGALPFSGHALFLAAAIAFDARSPRSSATQARLALSAVGLAVTSYYKVLCWDDTTWLVASLSVGAALGVLFKGSQRS